MQRNREKKRISENIIVLLEFQIFCLYNLSLHQRAVKIEPEHLRLMIIHIFFNMQPKSVNNYDQCLCLKWNQKSFK